MTATKKTPQAAPKAETEVKPTTSKVESQMAEAVEAATKAGAKAFKGYKGVFAFHKDNFDAVVEASNLWVTGVQDLNVAWSTFASKTVEQGVSSAKELMACTTVDDVVALNNKAAKSSYDAVVAETQSLHEMSIKLAETSAKPLASRVNETVAQLSKHAA